LPLRNSAGSMACADGCLGAIGSRRLRAWRTHDPLSPRRGVAIATSTLPKGRRS
jgi:hypothetical protein